MDNKIMEDYRQVTTIFDALSRAGGFSSVITLSCLYFAKMGGSHSYYFSLIDSMFY
jgi:hypothetical protein